MSAASPHLPPTVDERAEDLGPHRKRDAITITVKLDPADAPRALKREEARLERARGVRAAAEGKIRADEQVRIVAEHEKIRRSASRGCYFGHAIGTGLVILVAAIGYLGT